MIQLGKPHPVKKERKVYERICANPDCLKDLPNIKLVNFKGCSNLKLPEDLKVKLRIWDPS